MIEECINSVKSLLAMVSLGKKVCNVYACVFVVSRKYQQTLGQCGLCSLEWGLSGLRWVVIL